MITIEKHEHSVSLMQKISEIALRKEPQMELGYQIYSDSKHTWYLAYENDLLIGFCASVNKGNHFSFSHDYVLPEFRGGGVYLALFINRLNDFPKNIKAVATKKSINTFLRNGFLAVKRTANYTFVTK